MNHYILVSITIPEKAKADKWQAWMRLLNSPELKSKQCAEMQRLAENVWLLPRDNGKSYFAFLVREAELAELKAQALFLTEDD